MSSHIDYLDHVLKATSGALFVNLLIYSQLVGVSKQTSHNQLHLGTFPLKTVRLGRTVVVRAVDLAQFLETGIRQAEPPPNGRGLLGAPRKYSQAQRSTARKEKLERARKKNNTNPERGDMNIIDSPHQANTNVAPLDRQQMVSLIKVVEARS